MCLLCRWYTAALKLVPDHNSMPESPTSPHTTPLRHSVTVSMGGDDANNNRRARVMRRCQSELVAADKCASIRSRLVVHV